MELPVAGLGITAHMGQCKASPTHPQFHKPGCSHFSNSHDVPDEELGPEALWASGFTKFLFSFFKNLSHFGFSFFFKFGKTE